MVEVIVFAVLGWIAGAAIWIIARAQADRRGLFSGPVCDACSASLSSTAWVPFFGFGAVSQCQVCKARQGIVRPLFELGTAAYFAAAAAIIDDKTRLIAAICFSVPLLIVLLVDAWTRLIHTNIIILGTALGVLFAATDGLSDLGKSIIGILVGLGIFVGFFVLARVLYRSVKVVPFGLGDVYLAAMIGAMVRFPLVLSSLILGIILAAVVGVALLLAKRVSRKQAIPYGPYLCAGALVVILTRF
jgi:prepilin signal peptidase PulO-like enzyme (type II secretory pathway)